MDGGAWQATVHSVAKSWTQLSDFISYYKDCIMGLKGFPAGAQSVQMLSHGRLFSTPWTAARQASLSINNTWSLLRLMSIESVIPSSHLILCCPLLLLPPIPPSIRVFYIGFWTQA